MTGVRLRERLAARRAVWTFASQALSSGSNFVLTVLVLATVPVGAFAVFSVCLTTYLLLLQLARYVIGIPLLMGNDEPSAAVGVAAGAGVAVVPALLVAAARWAPGTSLLLVLAVAMPALLAQDALRHAAIARGRPDLAAAGDAAWLGLQGIGSAVLLGAAGSAGATATQLVAVWAAAGVVSAVLVARWLALAPAVDGARRWLRENRVVCRRVAVEFAANSGSYYALSYGLAALAGGVQLGYLRAAQTLFGPASVVLMGGALLGVPESVRMRGHGRRLRRFAVGLSAGLAALSIVCGAVVYVALPVVGPRLFPDSWAAIRSVIPWLTLFGAAIGAGAGAIAGLRALGASRWVLVGRGVTGAVALTAGLPAGAWFGARGTFAGLAVAECGLAVWAWGELRRRADDAAGLGREP